MFIRGDLYIQTLSSCTAQKEQTKKITDAFIAILNIRQAFMKGYFDIIYGVA